MIRILILLFIAPSLSLGQLKSYDIETIPQLQKESPRPVVIFLYADWCKYCKAMENSTFKKEGIISLINNDFYFVRFDGEQQEDVTLGGRTYSFKPSGNETGIHELAETLATIDGQVNYPTLVIANEQFEILYQYAGFMRYKELEKLLKLISNDEL